MSDRYIVVNPDTLEAMRRAGHVAKLEARIEKLEAALREVLSLGNWGSNILARTIILEALETTDCSLGEKDENT
jgi:hypothetical protein